LWSPESELSADLLKPGGRLHDLPPGLNQVIYVFSKDGVSQYALDPIARESLQDNPGMLRDCPWFGIKLPPHIVGSMIPRTARIQSQLRQGTESIDFRGKKAV